MVNEPDRVELGLSCAGVCQALCRGLNGKKADELNQSTYDAINQLNMWVKPVICVEGCPLKCSRSQDRDRYSDEVNEVGQTEHGFSAFPHEER